MQKVPIIALPSTSLYYVLKTVSLQRLLYQDYLDLNSTVNHKSHLLIYLCAIALPLCSTTYNRCIELWDADSSPSEGPVHPNLAFLCIPVSVGLDCLHFLVFSVGCIPGAILDMALEGCLGIADGSQPHRSILYRRECAGALNIGGLSWASGREVWTLHPSAEYFCAHTDGVRHLCFPLNSRFYSSLTVAWSVHDSHVTNAERARFVFILYYI